MREEDDLPALNRDDLRRLAGTQTPEKNHQLEVM